MGGATRGPEAASSRQPPPAVDERVRSLLCCARGRAWDGCAQERQTPRGEGRARRGPAFDLTTRCQLQGHTSEPEGPLSPPSCRPGDHSLPETLHSYTLADLRG